MERPRPSAKPDALTPSGVQIAPVENSRHSVPTIWLGVMMVQAAGRYQVDVVFSGLIVFAVLSLALTWMVQLLENRLGRWRPQRAGGE